MEYQLKIYDDTDTCIEESTGYENRAEAEREAYRRLDGTRVDRVEIYTNRFRELVAVI